VSGTIEKNTPIEKTLRVSRYIYVVEISSNSCKKEEIHIQGIELSSGWKSVIEN
jgi:hypothetical protein